MEGVYKLGKGKGESARVRRNFRDSVIRFRTGDFRIQILQGRDRPQIFDQNVNEVCMYNCSRKRSNTCRNLFGTYVHITRVVQSILKFHFWQLHNKYKII